MSCSRTQCSDAGECISLISFDYFNFRSPIYSLLVTGENFLVTGDDDGHIKVRKSM